MVETKKPIVIVGGGIVGLATAWKLLLKHGDEIQLTLLEKEPEPGRHQSGRNSGVLHAGLAYEPGSRKAVLATGGIRQMIKFCRSNQILYEQCGKLVVASGKEEVKRLRALMQRGEANGLKGLQLVQKDEMAQYEPYAGGDCGLWVPEEGIVDFPGVCNVLAQKIEQAGGEVRTGFNLTKVVLTEKGHLLISGDGEEIRADYSINCAGLYADRVCSAFGLNPGLKIIPFRGDYYRLKSASEYLVKNLIYPVADPRYPFLGLHFTRMARGGIEAGPNAVLAFAREGYSLGTFNLPELMESIRYPGFRKFLLRHRRMAWTELKSSASAKAFVQRLQKLVPELKPSDLEKGKSGVRAQAIDPKGFLVSDFYIKKGPASLHLLNAPSPAATASLAIADWIVEKADI